MRDFHVSITIRSQDKEPAVQSEISVPSLRAATIEEAIARIESIIKAAREKETPVEAHERLSGVPVEKPAKSK